MPLPKCAVLTCTNTADPRWYACDVNGHAVMICDGHDPGLHETQVAPRPLDPSAEDIAARVLYTGHVASRGEADRIARALLANDAKLAELRNLADLVRDADILALPPELVAVRQRWLAAAFDEGADGADSSASAEIP